MLKIRLDIFIVPWYKRHKRLNSQPFLMASWEHNKYSRLSVGAGGELCSETRDEPEPSKTVPGTESG